jgi:hypothetical protein
MNRSVIPNAMLMVLDSGSQESYVPQPVTIVDTGVIMIIIENTLLERV